MPLDKKDQPHNNQPDNKKPKINIPQAAGHAESNSSQETINSQDSHTKWPKELRDIGSNDVFYPSSSDESFHKRSNDPQDYRGQSQEGELSNEFKTVSVDRDLNSRGVGANISGRTTVVPLDNKGRDRSNTI